MLWLLYLQLTVIGVHSAKFPNEKSEQNIRHALHRNLIQHPVVCDNDLELWSRLSITCWPTFLLVNPNGLIVGEFIGEVQIALIETVLPLFFEYYDRILPGLASTLDSIQSIGYSVSDCQDTTQYQRGLCYPTKLCLNDDKQLLFLSDTGNNRICAIKSDTGDVVFSVGSTMSGYRDGPFESAQFNNPQGLVFDTSTDILYVADTGNNLVRKIDLVQRMVSTLCGKYEKQSHSLDNFDYVGGRPGLEQSISSPWDLCISVKQVDNLAYEFLLIACAGTHQLWLYPLNEKSSDVLWWRNVKIECNTLVCIVGNGEERNRNNSYPLKASLAQPSGLCVDAKGERVFVADAESSTIRVVSLKDGSVKNVAGGDALQPDNLHCYGDVDGKGTKARLQHPMDVRYFCDSDGEYLLVADAYNHKIKIIDLKDNMCKTLICVSINGDEVANGMMCEPNGLCIDRCRKRIYIADTNNHDIKVIDNFNDGQSHKPTVRNLKVNFSRVSETLDVVLNESDIVKQNHTDLYVTFDGQLNRLATNTWSMCYFYDNKGIGFVRGLSSTISRHSRLSSIGAAWDTVDLILANFLSFLAIYESCGNIEPSNHLTCVKIGRLDIEKVSSVDVGLTVFYCVNKNGAELCKMKRIHKQYNKLHLAEMKMENQIKIEIVLDEC